MVKKILIVLLTLFLAAQMSAQESVQSQARGRGASAESGRWLAGTEGESGACPISRWMQKLAERNPAEAEALRALRERDPVAFAARLKEQVEQWHLDRLLQRHPALEQILVQLPEPDRLAIERDLIRLLRRGRIGGRLEPDGDFTLGTTRPERKRGDARPSIEEFDAQTRRFETEVERAEARILELRKILEKRKAFREEYLRRGQRRERGD